MWPVNSIYIHTALHQPMTVVGYVLSLYSAAGFIGNLLGGWLYDRFGPILVLTSGLLLSALFILIPAMHTGWWSYIAVMGLFGTSCALPFPAMNALAGQAWPEGGRKAYNFVYVSNNVGVALGTALGGPLSEWSYHAVFYGIAIAYSLYLFLVLVIFRKSFRKIHQEATFYKAKDSLETTKRSEDKVPWTPILILIVGFTLCWLVYVQWQCTMSVYMQSLGYSRASYSLLWTINGVLIFLGQPLVAAIVRRIPSLTAHMKLGIVLFALAYACLLVSSGYAVFLCGMVIMTLGEMFVWPSVPSAVAAISPSTRLGLLQGTVTAAATCGRMLGPIFGGILYDTTSVQILLFATISVCILPFACILIYTRITQTKSNRDSVNSVTKAL